MQCTLGARGRGVTGYTLAEGYELKNPYLNGIN